MAGRVMRAPLFRAEAVRELARRGEGEVLDLSPRWLRWSYWVLLDVAALAAAFLGFAGVTRHAAGPAIVIARNRTEVVAPARGVIVELLATPGHAVRAGELLARLDDQSEREEVERLERLFETLLARTLLDPHDAAVRDRLAAARLDRDRARARLRERVLFAPRHGIAADLHVQPGQRVEAGEPVLTLASEDTELAVVALLPGEDRPYLSPGAVMFFDLGVAHPEARPLIVESAGEAAIGAAELRRYLGPALSDVVPPGGRAFVATAQLPTATFEADGRALRYHHGMVGRARVPVRHESVLFALAPGLRRLMEER